MLTAPPDPDKGDNILAWARAANRVLRAIIPRESPEIWPDVSPTGGTKYRAKRENGKKQEAQGQVEFALYDASSGGTLKVGVKFGNVNCYAITGGLQPWPADFVSTTTPPYTYEFEVSADGVAWLEVNNDTSGATDKVDSIALGNGATMPSSDTETGYLALGNWSVTPASGATAASLTILNGKKGIGNQGYTFCGGYHQFF